MNSSSLARSRCQTPQVGMPAAVINMTLALAMLFYLPAAHSADQREGEKIRIVAFGDSLTAGFGLKPGQGFPEVLQMALNGRGHNVEVINAGVSGDTTAAGLARLDWAVGEEADAVIVELGANDALRGQPPAKTRANLDAILSRLEGRGLPVLVAGMRSPENWGSDYRDRFDAIFAELAAKHGALLYPFFLASVATDPKLNLPDGLHPNARGITVIVERILPEVEALIERVKQARTASK